MEIKTLVGVAHLSERWREEGNKEVKHSKGGYGEKQILVMLKRKSGSTEGRHLHAQQPLSCLLLCLLSSLEPPPDCSLQLFPDSWGEKEEVGQASPRAIFPQSSGKIVLLCPISKSIFLFPRYPSFMLTI